MRQVIYISLILPLALLIMTACSSTSALPEGEQLYTGIKKISYSNHENNDHFIDTQEEMNVALAAQPNGALFGSSYYRSPFPVGLWMWNAFSKSERGFGKWLHDTFGTKPVTISQVNPELHKAVGESALRKMGYFNGKVSYDIITQRNPKKAKISYDVDLGHLYTYDSISYVNFPAEGDTLLSLTCDMALIKKDDPFDVSKLDAERNRVAQLFRDNGFYYYEKTYASYLADTINVPGKVAVKLQMADSLPDNALHKWYIGHITVNYRKQMRENFTTTRKLRSYTINYSGTRSPLRFSVMRNALKLRKGQPYSQALHEQSYQNLMSTGLYSYVNFKFAPADTTLNCDTLNLTLDCMLDKRYDFYIETNARGKTNGNIGPELILGVTKRNAFRGAELLDVSLHGSYEWQTGHKMESTSSGINSYQYGIDASLTFPKIVTPWSLLFKKDMTKMTREERRAYMLKRMRRNRFYDTPTTTVKASFDILNRGSYYKRHVVSGELRYNWQKSAQSRFEFSPLTVSYEYMKEMTDTFINILIENPYLAASMEDRMIPKMSFTYEYLSPSTYRNPIKWWTTVSEASNLLSVGYMLSGRDWSKKGKKIFNNPYDQFVKFESGFTKTWRLSESSSLVGHVNAGVIWTYGNSEYAPYTEMFYVGGANSIRAFNVRSIGPGDFMPDTDKAWSYVEQVGDIKLLMNLEYRPRIFGSLYGALFLDTGNVWEIHSDEEYPDVQFKFGKFFKQLALGTGVGLRYDIGYFTVRLDWGVGLHVPYDTGKSGFYNIRRFHDGQAIHLAVGMPF
ncbi:MAG: BamA/TamA family outer membrane protein [Prevotella sp.]|nr:BamA/TamA family outer membrane protein [Prevotella sp.]